MPPPAAAGLDERRRPSGRGDKDPAPPFSVSPSLAALSSSLPLPCTRARGHRHSRRLPPPREPSPSSADVPCSSASPPSSSLPAESSCPASKRRRCRRFSRRLPELCRPDSPPSGYPRPAGLAGALRVSSAPSPPASPLPEPLLHRRWLAGRCPERAGMAAQLDRVAWAFLANVAWLVGLGPHCQPLWLE
jgi:hypothetical protein